MEPVFAHADKLFSLLNELVRRPRKGELPPEVPDRDAIPVLGLVGDRQDRLVEQVRRALGEAQPRRVPHEVIAMDERWDEVAGDRADLAPDWQRSELCRRVLVQLAQEYSSARGGHDRRVRFRRFGLVNWLLEMTCTDEEPDSRHDQGMLSRLRDREFERRPVLGFLRSPGTEVALQGKVPWWAYVFGLYVLPLMWFRAWRVLGSEYRWLLRQPYMAPGDPGTFAGFALRLTQPRWGREDPDQVVKLMINAFLEDLRVAYRRRLWRRRAARRTAYCVAFLRGVSDANRGRALVRSFMEVRRETGAFDPLLIITSCTEDEHDHERTRVRSLTEELTPYEAWCERLRSAGRSRGADFWYLPVRVPAPLPEGHPDLEAQNECTSAARRFTVGRPPAWAGRAATTGAVALALALVVGGVGGMVERDGRWKEAHCGLARSHADAATVTWQKKTGECVGVASHGFAFKADDRKLDGTLKVIAAQNRRAEKIHRMSRNRPLVTLVHVSAMFSSPDNEPSEALSYAREQLQGVASAQWRQLGPGVRGPVLRILPANAGSGMRYGTEVAAMVGGMMESDPTIVGVTGLDESRQATIRTIGALTRAGLPMVATTPSADTLDDHSPLYHQVSPQNWREAEVAAAYAGELFKTGKVKKREVLVLYSADRSDAYSRTLWEDVRKAFEGKDFVVTPRKFAPGSRTDAFSGTPGANSVGQDVCHDKKRMVFFAGRSEDFEDVLHSVDSICGSSEPFILGGDDVARLGADAARRSAFHRLTYDFLDFTPNTASCDGSGNLYSTMKELFQEECPPVATTYLDGHAALAFDAVSVYLRAFSYLMEKARGMELTPHAVWQALGTVHGDRALDGESGVVDFGGEAGGHTPVDKLISIQRVDSNGLPAQRAYCGRWTGKTPAAHWCPASEAGKS
ncbi:ABC transporter substrate-binding protein [Streptomyces aurantiacus]|uniref:ABC transporter substrate-binding protein n=1 Tax=Streptomyces aurantiacus TaxID=47760 RepID=UPI0006E39D36|nr:ABC transporter substrate-binding protein [Streptomyces aurantiacus]